VHYTEIPETNNLALNSTQARVPSAGPTATMIPAPRASEVANTSSEESSTAHSHPRQLENQLRRDQNDSEADDLSTDSAVLARFAQAPSSELKDDKLRRATWEAVGEVLRAMEDSSLDKRIEVAGEVISAKAIEWKVLRPPEEPSKLAVSHSNRVGRLELMKIILESMGDSEVYKKISGLIRTLMFWESCNTPTNVLSISSDVTAMSQGSIAEHQQSDNTNTKSTDDELGDGQITPDSTTTLVDSTIESIPSGEFLLSRNSEIRIMTVEDTTTEESEEPQYQLGLSSLLRLLGVLDISSTQPTHAPPSGTTYAASRETAAGNSQTHEISSTSQPGSPPGCHIQAETTTEPAQPFIETNSEAKQSPKPVPKLSQFGDAPIIPREDLVVQQNDVLGESSAKSMPPNTLRALPKRVSELRGKHPKEIIKVGGDGKPLPDIRKYFRYWAFRGRKLKSRRAIKDFLKKRRKNGDTNKSGGTCGKKSSPLHNVWNMRRSPSPSEASSSSIQTSTARSSGSCSLSSSRSSCSPSDSESDCDKPPQFESSESSSDTDSSAVEG
jgi:hypothetical protein